MSGQDRRCAFRAAPFTDSAASNERGDDGERHRQTHRSYPQAEASEDHCHGQPSAGFASQGACHGKSRGDHHHDERNVRHEGPGKDEKNRVQAERCRAGQGFPPAQVQLAEQQVEAAKTEDREHGGFFFVSHDHEQLLYRAKSGRDHATPSGNGIAALALNRLGHLAGEPRYSEAAARTLRAFKTLLEQEPIAHTSLCAALEEELAPPAVVILRGDEAGDRRRRPIDTARRR
jgi:hypothetical protein